MIFNANESLPGFDESITTGGSRPRILDMLVFEEHKVNSIDFQEYCQTLDQKAYDVMHLAASEYSTQEDRFSNFKRAAQALRRNSNLSCIMPIDIALIYFQKHMDSIISGVSLREDMERRIIDAMNYLRLIGAMYAEYLSKEQINMGLRKDTP